MSKNGIRFDEWKFLDIIVAKNVLEVHIFDEDDSTVSRVWVLFLGIRELCCFLSNMREFFRKRLIENFKFNINFTLTLFLSSRNFSVVFPCASSVVTQECGRREKWVVESKCLSISEITMCCSRDTLFFILVYEIKFFSYCIFIENFHTNCLWIISEIKILLRLESLD